MKKAVILHGMPSKKGYYDKNRESQSNEHWFPWLQHELLLRDILAQTPELPKPYKPNYQEWLKVFNQFIVDKDTILIGHSCGAGFLIRWLSENKVKVGKVVFVAPWLDPHKKIRNTFFNFDIDKHLVNKTQGITIFNSDNDFDEVQESVKKLRDIVKGIKYKEFHNYGHFCFVDMKKREFPELLKEALR